MLKVSQKKSGCTQPVMCIIADKSS